MNAFVFALDQVPEQQVNGTSTPFLLLEGQALWLFVLVALDRVRDIKQITIIGPQKKIMQVLESALFSGLLFSKKVLVQEQKGSLTENIFSACEHALQEDQEKDNPLKVLPSDEPALFLPGDIPLVTTAEIEAFIAGSDMSQYDVAMGISSESSFRPFYPDANHLGIKKPCFELKDAACRLNNLYLFRPRQIAQCMTRLRPKNPQQKNGKNRSDHRERPIWRKALPFYISNLFDTALNQTERSKIETYFQKNIPLETLEESLHNRMNLKIKFIERWKGAGALNIDDRDSYEAISVRINDWRAYLDRLNQNEKGEMLCPISGESCQSE